jgi:integrase/recombinase XerD
VETLQACTVPMSPRLHRVLTQHRAHEGGEGRVLRSAHGKDMITDAQRRALQRVARYAGVPVYGIHALRHCFGARLMLNGEGAKVVMRLLGHAKLQTTERYVHASDARCRNAAERLAPL